MSAEVLGTERVDPEILASNRTPLAAVGSPLDGAASSEDGPGASWGDRLMLELGICCFVALGAMAIFDFLVGMWMK